MLLRVPRSRRFWSLFVLIPVVAAAAICAPTSDATPGAGYQRAILVSWDGVRRDVLHELLEKDDPAVPCWEGAAVYPVDTGRVRAGGEAIFTCLPALAGAKPAGVPESSPAYGPFQVIASHTTDDGTTMTKPQHASMLTGLDTEVHGLTDNISIARMPEGFTIYERLMNYFDPISVEGRRDGYVFRTHHSADQKFAGRSINFTAKRNRALQVSTGHGSEVGTSLGALKYAMVSFDRWKADAITYGQGEPSFFMFLHFKSTDWAGHVGGDRSRGYREAIVATDKRLYLLMESLRGHGWEDTPILVSTDHGFDGNQHSRNGGRTVFNTWLAARNVTLDTSGISTRTTQEYCASHASPADCLAGGPAAVMPPEDAVPNVYVTDIVPTILDMFGVEWRTTTNIQGRSLYNP